MHLHQKLFLCMHQNFDALCIKVLMHTSKLISMHASNLWCSLHQRFNACIKIYFDACIKSLMHTHWNVWCMHRKVPWS